MDGLGLAERWVEAANDCYVILHLDETIEQKTMGQIISGGHAREHSGRIFEVACFVKLLCIDEDRCGRAHTYERLGRGVVLELESAGGVRGQRTTAPDRQAQIVIL